MLRTKSKGKEEKNTTLRKLQYHKGTGAYLLVMPIDFVRKANLEESYFKMTLIDKDKNLLNKPPYVPVG